MTAEAAIRERATKPLPSDVFHLLALLDAERAETARLRAALVSEDEIAHGEAYEPSRGGLGVCAYCDGKWPCRTQRGIDRALNPAPPTDAEGEP